MSAHGTPPLTVEEAHGLLRAAGLRRTMTRIHVLQCLAEQTAPVTHSQIVAELAAVGFDSSTIFRGLADLVEAAIVTRLDLGDHSWRFELRRSNSPPTHPHLLCIQCGCIQCLKPEELASSLPAGDTLESWSITEILLKGHCPGCQLNPSPNLI